MAKKTIRDYDDFAGKKVLIRVDFNVPLDKKSGDGTITNDRRIRAALPTLQYLLDRGACIIAMSHLGRPTGDPKKDVSLRMDRVAVRLGELLGKTVQQTGDTVVGPEVQAHLAKAKPGEVYLLQNLRFDAREQTNDPDFARAIADLGDIYVNDAFGTCHNEHDASMVAVPQALATNGNRPRLVGFLVEKELRILDQLLTAPKRPFVGILGGGKVSDKIEFIKELMKRVDHILIGGAMTYTFLKAQGINIGSSRCEADKLELANDLLALGKDKIILPIDHLIADQPKTGANTKVVNGSIPDHWFGMDIGPETISKYQEVISQAGTVVWNGPMGMFEVNEFSKGTQAIGAAMSNSRAITVVGGGETAEAAEQFGYDSKMTHVSTGGGAFLSYIENPDFPSLRALENV